MRDDHDEGVLGKLGNDDCIARTAHFKARIVGRIPATNHLVRFHVMAFEFSFSFRYFKNLLNLPELLEPLIQLILILH